MTRNRSPSSAQTSRLPSRRSATTVRPCACVDRRIERADQERAGEPDAIEPLTDDARSQRVQVQLDVRKFRHAYCALIDAASRSGAARRSAGAGSARALSAARGLHAPVRMHGQRLGERRFGGVAELMRDVVAGRAVAARCRRRSRLRVGVLERERHRHEHLVAEVEAVLADRLAVGRVADDRDRNVRPQRVDDQLARRRRAARRDHHQPLQVQRLRGISRKRVTSVEGAAQCLSLCT